MNKIQDSWLFLFWVFVSCSNKNKLADQPIFHIPEGFTFETVVSQEDIAYPMFASFDDQGRLFEFESTKPNDMDSISAKCFLTRE